MMHDEKRFYVLKYIKKIQKLKQCGSAQNN